MSRTLTPVASNLKSIERKMLDGSFITEPSGLCPRRLQSGGVWGESKDRRRCGNKATYTSVDFSGTLRAVGHIALRLHVSLTGAELSGWGLVSLPGAPVTEGHEVFLFIDSGDADETSSGILRTPY